MTDASTGRAEKGGTFGGVNNFKVILRGFANTSTEPIVFGPNGYRKVTWTKSRYGSPFLTEKYETISQ